MPLFEGSNLWFTIAFIVLAATLRLRGVPWSAWGGPFVSIGILGTFWGILIALLSFDVSNIEQSVPGLIDGMKTAFATSVVGISVSVSTKIWDLIRPREVDVKGASAEDYLLLMRAQAASLEAIKAGIGGESDSSLLVQVQKLRLDMQDFMKKLSAQSTDAIVDALKEVIRDFNAKINEQFGDNFKQLNEAVGRLVAWMNTHQELVTSSHAQLAAAVSALEAASGAMGAAGSTLTAVAREVQSIRQSLAATSTTVASIPPSLDQVRESLRHLSGDADALAKNVTALGDAVATLTAANETLTEAMDRWSELAEEAPSAAEAIQGMVESVRSHADAVTEQQRQLVLALREEVAKLARDLEMAHQALVRRLGESLQGEIQTLARGLREAQSAHLARLQEALDDSGKRNKEAIEAQIRALDTALAGELSQALQLLGRKLGSLSEQFANDYGPLTAELGRIVQMARHIEPDRPRGAQHA